MSRRPTQSDSRVPPELVFDQGFGDLFVIRVAGNVVASDVVGSIQYAIAHLHTPLMVVMGHEGCGAVTAAVESLAGRGTEPKYIGALIARIEPGLANLPSTLRAPTGSVRRSRRTCGGRCGNWRSSRRPRHSWNARPSP